MFLFLRVAGVLNAAVWLGSMAAGIAVVSPAFASDDLRQLIGPNNFPFYSVAMAQLAWTRLLMLHCVCAGFALAHLAAEWLYSSRPPSRALLGVLGGLFLIAVLQAGWLQPRLNRLHREVFSLRATAQQKGEAAEDYRFWRAMGGFLKVLSAAGAGLYAWQMSSAGNPGRFLGAGKFRG